MRGFTIVLIGAPIGVVLLFLYRNKKRKEEEARRRWNAGDPSILFEWAGDALYDVLLRDPLVERRMQLNEEARCRANLFSAVVNSTVGVFKRMNTVGEPIFKHVSGGAWGMQQINSSQVICKPSWFGTTSQFAGKASSFIALAIDGATVIDAVVEDYRRGSMHNTICSVSKAAGGYYGAAHGAANGANALSFVPLIGPLAGGFIGGSLGMASGSSIGGYVAKAITAMPGC